MRFLVDRCPGRRLAQWLQQQGHDVRETRERHPDPGDTAILRWAADENRIVVTIDTDFGALVFLHGARHCGAVRLPDVPAQKRIALMDEVLQRYAQQLESAAVVTVRGGRLRVSTAS